METHPLVCCYKWKIPTRIHKAHKQEKLWPIRCGPSKIEHILGYSGPVLNGFRFPKTDQWIHQFLDSQAFWPNSLLFLYWYPIGSMYAIYSNIYHQYTPNVSIYTIHGSYGYYVSIAILVKPTAFDQRGKKKWLFQLSLPSAKRRLHEMEVLAYSNSWMVYFRIFQGNFHETPSYKWMMHKGVALWLRKPP